MDKATTKTIPTATTVVIARMSFESSLSFPLDITLVILTLVILSVPFFVVSRTFHTNGSTTSKRRV